MKITPCMAMKLYVCSLKLQVYAKYVVNFKVLSFDNTPVVLADLIVSELCAAFSGLCAITASGLSMQPLFSY